MPVLKYYDGSAWSPVASALQGPTGPTGVTGSTGPTGPNPGLTLIKSQTIGTTVSSFTVTDAFSSAYDNYKIFVSGGISSASGTFGTLTYGSAATNYSNVLIYTFFTSAVYNGLAGDLGTGITYALTGTGTNGIFMNMDVLSPYLSKYTTHFGSYNQTDASGRVSGMHKTAASYTDFTITMNSGTLTGGTVSVYGYQKQEL